MSPYIIYLFTLSIYFKRFIKLGATAPSQQSLQPPTLSPASGLCGGIYLAAAVAAGRLTLITTSPPRTPTKRISETSFSDKLLIYPPLLLLHFEPISSFSAVFVIYIFIYLLILTSISLQCCCRFVTFVLISPALTPSLA